MYDKLMRGQVLEINRMNERMSQIMKMTEKKKGIKILQICIKLSGVIRVEMFQFYTYL